MKKISCILPVAFCLMVAPLFVVAQDSLAKAKGYDKIPSAANPKQLNRTDKGGTIDTKATSSKLPPGAVQPANGTASGYDKAPPPNPNASNATVPAKAPNYDLAPKPKSNAPVYGEAPPAKANSNTATPSQDNYDDVPAPPVSKTPSVNKLPNSNGYNKAPANNASGNNAQNKNPYQQLPVKPKNEADNNLSATPSQDNYDDVPNPPVNKTSSVNKLPNTNGYNKAPANNASGNNAQNKSQYQQLPIKPKNEPDNNLSANPSQDNYDDVPASSGSKTTNTNGYDKVPPVVNPKQLNKTTATKDLNTQVQQKATNQYGPPPVSGSAAANPKSQYGALPPPGRTQQYGTVPPKNAQGQPAANANNTVKQPAATGTKTQQYGPAPVLPKTTTSTPPQKAPPPTPTYKKG